MENPVKKELINGIVEFFEDYEEIYVPGEWESFSKTKRKKYSLFLPWIKVAAMFFLISSVFLFLYVDFNSENKENITTNVSKVKDINQRNPEKQDLRILNKNLPENRTSSARTKLQNKKYRTQTENNTIILPIDSVIRENGVNLAALPAKNQDANLIVEPGILNYPALRKDQIAISDLKQPDSVMQKSTSDFLLAESKVTRLAKINKNEVKEDKWNFGIEVMPTVTKSNLNVGAGLTTVYRLSKNFSLSSGVSILQLEAAGTVPPGGSGGSQLVKSSFIPKQLLAMDANISAIDIPIGLVYNVNKNFYTSIGVSYFNVIREKRNNTYLTTVQQDPSKSFVSAAYNLLQSQAVEEPVSGSPLKGNSYLGFFNFSVGRKQDVFNHYQILIEPFVKIPVGKLSAQDLQLTNSGVKFKLSF